MKIINKRESYEYDTDYNQKEILKLVKLISIFLQDKENINKDNLYKLIKYFYDYKIDIEDYLDYVKEKTNFDKTLEIATDIVIQHMNSEGHGRDFSWWTENYQRIIEVATKDFIPTKEIYTIKEIKELITNGNIYPLYPFGRETKLKRNEYKDDINYLLPYMSKELESTDEYFDFIFNKIMLEIGNDNLLNNIRRFIVNLKLNSIEDYNRIYSKEDYEYKKNNNELADQLIVLYNNFDKDNQIKSEPLDIVIDYIKRLPNIEEQWYTEITLEQIVSVIDQLDYNIDKDICKKIEEMIISLGEEELCYEMAANIEWINKKIMAEIVIASENPDINYYYASEVEGADIERHKQVILNNEHSDNYILERAKSLSLIK